MSMTFDDGEPIRLARRHFITAMTAKNAFPPDRPVKILVDILFVALNTSTPKDIQRAKIWIMDYVLPSSERTHLFNTFLVTLSRTFRDGALPTSGNRLERSKVSAVPTNHTKSSSNDGSVLTAQKKRLHMLNVLSDVLATLFPSQLEIPRKELPSIDKTSVIYELKHHLVILAQMAAASASPNTGGTTASDSVNHITKTLLPNWVQRGIFTAEDGTSLEAKIRSHAAKDVSQIAAELRLDQEIDTISSSILFSDTLTLDKILPKRHHLPDHPNASWDTLPAMNGLFLRRIRGFPLRAGALQNGLTLQNAGKKSSPETNHDITTTYATALRLTRRFTPAAEIADIDGLGNVIYTQSQTESNPHNPDLNTADKSSSISTTRPLNYTALPKDSIPLIRALDSKFAKGALGYEGVPKVVWRRGKFGGGASGGGAFGGSGGRGGFYADFDRGGAGMGRGGRPPEGARFSGGGNRGGGGGGGGGGYRGRGRGDGYRGSSNYGRGGGGGGGYGSLLDD